MRYCCDGLCNQGRDCPARVAKVGQRYPKHPQAYPDSIWRRHLKKLAYWMLMALIGLTVWPVLIYLVLRA